MGKIHLIGKFRYSDFLLIKLITRKLLGEAKVTTHDKTTNRGITFVKRIVIETNFDRQQSDLLIKTINNNVNFSTAMSIGLGSSYTILHTNKNVFEQKMNSRELMLCKRFRFRNRHFAQIEDKLRNKLGIQIIHSKAFEFKPQMISIEDFNKY